MTITRTLTRRSLLGTGAALGGAALLGSGSRRAWAQDYPSRPFNVTIPTGQGGGAERLARSFDSGWSKLLGQPFEYEFFPGAGGQVGYELFVHQREHDGQNMLFGNMGPEMIMYVTQKPNYSFPEDYIYFCRIDIDDSIIFVSRDSPIKDIQQVVDEAKKRTLNVAVSRIPHPASIGVLALGEATGGQYNLIPYGGGNPTTVAVLNGEVDIGALPIAGVVRLPDKLKVLGVFNRTENKLAQFSDDAPTINSVFNTDIPDLYSSRSWAVHTDWADGNPEDFQKLQETSAKVFEMPEFKEAYLKTGSPWEGIAYGDREVCTEYALKMVELAKRYESVLTGKA